jgi:DNA-binding FadR family transcriptional regulator
VLVIASGLKLPHGDELPRQRSREVLEHTALKWLRNGNEPAGARRLAEVFRAEGAEIAEATAGRLLRSLDEAGLTRQVGVRGRALTERGLRRLEALTQQQALSAQTELVALAIEPDTATGLIELLTARRAIEPDAARLAALNASDSELAAIAASADHRLDRTCRHVDERLTEAHGLHRLIAEASHNKIIAAIVGLLVDQRHDDLARLLDDFVLATGNLPTAANDHGTLVAALLRRDPVAAEAAMRSHLDGLVTIAEYGLASTREDSAE